MRKVNLLFFILFFGACSNSKVQVPFYEVKSNEKTVGYILGTIHSNIKLTQLPSKVLNAFTSSKDTYFERTPRRITKDDIIPTTWARKDSLLIKDWLDKKNYQKVMSLYKNVKLDKSNLKTKEYVVLSNALKNDNDNNLEDSLNRLSPYGLLSLVIDKPGYHKLMALIYGFHDEKVQLLKSSLDYKLYQKAIKNGSRTYALDSSYVCESEIYKIEQAPYLQLILNIANNLDPKESYKLIGFSEEQKGTVIKKYLKSSLNNLSDVIDDKAMTSKFNQPIYNCLFKKRNIEWANFLSEYFGGRSKVFIAVGAAHLLHSKEYPSLINVLEKKGFTINKI